MIMKRTMAAELAAVQKIPSVDAARARLNNRPCRRSMSMSLIEFARVTMPATSAGTSTLNWRPGFPTQLAHGPRGQTSSS
jgi:hypothetical protein